MHVNDVNDDDNDFGDCDGMNDNGENDIGDEE